MEGVPAVEETRGSASRSVATAKNSAHSVSSGATEGSSAQRLRGPAALGVADRADTSAAAARMAARRDCR